jgi:hypothetical protein
MLYACPAILFTVKLMGSHLLNDSASSGLLLLLLLLLLLHGSSSHAIAQPAYHCTALILLLLVNESSNLLSACCKRATPIRAGPRFELARPPAAAAPQASFTFHICCYNIVLSLVHQSPSPRAKNLKRHQAHPADRVPAPAVVPLASSKSGVSLLA